ncbi:MAG: multiubiquitin domain-containing protein [Flavobacteriaceae bacterium]
MNGKFNIFKGKDDQYYFNLVAGNHEIILQSEGYTSKQGAKNGIQSVQKNCTNDENYERKIAKDGSPYFVLKAKNGEPIGKSEMYSSKQVMEKGISSVKRNGVTTIIQEDSVIRNINIFINKTKYRVSKAKLNGAEILAIADLSAKQYCLFLINGSEQEEIKAEVFITLKNGMHFQAIINDIKFG